MRVVAVLVPNDERLAVGGTESLESAAGRAPHLRWREAFALIRPPGKADMHADLIAAASAGAHAGLAAEPAAVHGGGGHHSPRDVRILRGQVAGVCPGDTLGGAVIAQQVEARCS